MTTETPEPTERQAQQSRAGWRQWLQVVLAGVALLALSEALWLWQTWPVRELLHPVAAGVQPAGRP